MVAPVFVLHDTTSSCCCGEESLSITSDLLGDIPMDSEDMLMPSFPGEFPASAELPERNHAPDKPTAESMTVATAMLYIRFIIMVIMLEM